MLNLFVVLLIGLLAPIVLSLAWLAVEEKKWRETKKKTSHVLSKKAYASATRRARETMAKLARSQSGNVSLSQKGNVSTIFAQNNSGRAKNVMRKLDLSAFVGIVDFDPAAMTVRVAGKTTFKQLTEFLLRRGFAPKVVPELDTITVGGAISGVGIESSSFRYGFVHNTMVEVDVLLGDGRVVTANEKAHEDLFRGIAHSYGTLGYVLSVTLSVIPVTKDVSVTARRLCMTDAIAEMKRAIAAPCCDFIEGIAFAKDDALIVTAHFSQDCVGQDRVAVPDDGRFKDILERRAPRIGTVTRFQMSTYDYLWRWDADMFWGTEGVPLLGSPFVRRRLTRRVLRSTVLRRLGNLAKTYLSDTSREGVIQDLGVPFDGAAKFIERCVDGEHAALPFWLCPARFEGIAREASLFPPPKCCPSSGGWLLDVASFGSVPRDERDKYFHNRALESLVDAMGGSKTFYSDVLYTREYVHDHYNGDEYDRLKALYDPTGRFPELYDKIANRD